MNRHISSFLIALVLYVSVVGLVIYQSNDDSFCDKKSPENSVRRVCFSVVSEEVPVQKHTPKETKRVEKKVERKVQKRAEKKVEKVAPKKEPLPKTVPETTEEPASEAIEEMIEKPAISRLTGFPVRAETMEVAQPEEAPTEAVTTAEQAAEKAAVTAIQKEIDQELLQARQDRFLSHLVEKINRNKSYPRIARRRGMEGSVEVAFHILSDGSVNNIKLVSGRKVFSQSAFEAISKSFPVQVDSAIFDFPKEFRVTLAYVLK